MVVLEFCKKPENKRTEIVDTFYKKNLTYRNKSKVAKLDTWCNKYLTNVLQPKKGDQKSYNFEAVVKATPKELLLMKRHLDQMANLDVVMDELKEKTNNGKARCYVRDTLYGAMHDDARRWIINSLDVMVCPYCNRNYVFSKANADTCDLDHFIPEGKYQII